MVDITDFINKEHDDFYYEPSTGRLFKIQEIIVTEESDHDSKVRSTRRKFNGIQRLCTHIIFFIMTSKWPEPGNLIDHKDNNPYNNEWKNLREATYTQNAHNRQSSGRWNHADKGLEMGVEVTPFGRYRVKLRGKHLGTFLTIPEANACILAARKEAYGEFDYHNGRREQ